MRAKTYIFIHFLSLTVMAWSLLDFVNSNTAEYDVISIKWYNVYSWKCIWDITENSWWGYCSEGEPPLSAEDPQAVRISTQHKKSFITEAARVIALLPWWHYFPNNSCSPAVLHLDLLLPSHVWPQSTWNLSIMFWKPKSHYFINQMNPAMWQIPCLKGGKEGKKERERRKSDK